jgi:hypothetical protein
MSARTRSTSRCTISDAVPLCERRNQVDAADSAHNSGTDQPYPDTRQLVEALRAQTPPELQYLIDDGFNRIVLYDNKTLSASSKKLPDGRYKVRLEVQARKVQADGNGAETSMPLADYIDIGVFKGLKDEEQPLTCGARKSPRSGRRSPLWSTNAPHAPGSIHTTSSSTVSPTTT